LEGSTLRQDNDANKNIYGRDITAKEIVLEGKVQPTPGGQAIDDVLNKQSPKISRRNSGSQVAITEMMRRYGWYGEEQSPSTGTRSALQR